MNAGLSNNLDRFENLIEAILKQLNEPYEKNYPFHAHRNAHNCG